ncbi:IclR family transcriptional regulator [Saccharopolyspora mangrovi]|uniref:IclR family transcriptional regulator n=1 Tax=Saccharopolyspora mangrovi TaxID=3082379 RepID=A0ABU6AJY1_9PSEU|nr:IclR family transcriptional regulator [Saccharopolyspora sp. S2-29]MEB3371887.1 IclR family transcriptional regulator [Saccharopolyspora sp. S2-29]
MPNEDPATLAAEHRTVSRVMGIVEAVAGNEPHGLKLGDLADAVGAPKSSVHGLAKGLVALGYLQESDARYFIGPAAPSLVSAKTDGLRQRATTEQLTGLRDKWNETAMAGVLVGQSVVYVQSVESSHTLRAAVPLNSRVQLWPASSGKCLLADMPRRRLEGYFKRIGVVGEERDNALEELEQVKEQGYALNLGGTAVGMFGVASPITTSDQKVTMTIAVTGPELRLTGQLDALAADVRQAAIALSHAG